MAAQVKELTKEVEGWKRKYQKVKQKYNAIQRELDDIRKDNQKLSEEKDILQGVSDRYDRVVRVLGIETVDAAVQQDIRNEKALEEKQRMEQMPKGSIHERLAWVFSHEEIYRNVWKEEPIDCANAVMCCISQLRKKLKVDSRNWNYIRTVRGVGYKFQPLSGE